MLFFGFVLKGGVEEDREGAAGKNLTLIIQCMVLFFVKPGIMIVFVYTCYACTNSHRNRKGSKK